MDRDLPNPEEEVDNPTLPPMDAETEELWSSRGLVLRVSPGTWLQSMVSFKHTIMMNVLLPPIILSSGYDLKQRHFFRSFGVILGFAFVGTFISAMVIGLVVFLWSQLGFEGLQPGIIECLIFGSSLSATDPVTVLGVQIERKGWLERVTICTKAKPTPRQKAVRRQMRGQQTLRPVVVDWCNTGKVSDGSLKITGSVSLNTAFATMTRAIFNALKVEPKLYSVIFGESLLNDAVAIVMFETLKHVHTMVPSLYSVIHGVGVFLLVFSISMFLGAVFGLGCSLMLKHSRLGEWPDTETCLVFLIAYTSYFFSNALNVSGIVSLLFCGITLKHYAYHNMSHKTQKTTKYIFHTLSQLSENFIFIYLGLTLFTQTDLVYKPLFIAVTAVAVVMARYCAVFPLSNAINWIFRAKDQALGANVSHHHVTSSGALPYANDHTPQPEIPHAHQMMLFWAGLRGAVDVALAAGIEGPHAKSLRTTVLVNVVLSMMVFGGTTMKMIEVVGVRTGVVDEEDSSDDEDDMRYFQEGGYGMVDDRDRERGYKDDGSHRSLPRSNSDVSLASMDSGDEVLPQGGADPAMGGNAVWRDGQWFTVLDERFLLPVFSNATASRRQAARKSMRRSTTALDQYDPDGSPSGAASPISLNSPWLGPSDGRSPNGRRTFSPALMDQSGNVGKGGTGNGIGIGIESGSTGQDRHSRTNGSLEFINLTGQHKKKKSVELPHIVTIHSSTSSLSTSPALSPLPSPRHHSALPPSHLSSVAEEHGDPGSLPSFRAANTLSIPTAVPNLEPLSRTRSMNGKDERKAS
ncbi:sodium/hydrogen exchanger [Atractiella rhizophila]|nr:sodium/hydrogen exchanger [Atractiella rhizophila]